MGVVVRQSVKTSFVVFFGAFLGVFITWLSTKFLSQQQFGFSRNLTTEAIVAGQILLVGLNTTLFVNIHNYEGEIRKQKLLFTLCLLVPLLLTSLFFIPYFAFPAWIIGHFQPGDIPLIKRFYYILPVYTTLFILQILLEQYLGSQMKVAIGSFVREIVLRVINILLILAYAFGYLNFDYFIIFTVFSYLVPVILYFWFASKIKEFGFSFRLRDFSRKEYKDLGHFSWFHSLLTLTTILMGYLDALALPLYDHSGFRSVAIYGVAVFLISFLQMPSKAMMMPTVTVLAQAIARKDNGHAADIFVRSSVNILIATVLMAILISCNLQNAIAIINHGYENILPIFVILLVGRFIDLATGLNDAILSITKYYSFSFYVSAITITILFVLIKILVPAYGIFGAAISTSVALLFFNAAKYIFVWKKLNMQPFTRKTVVVLVCGLPTVFTGYFLPHLFNSVANRELAIVLDSALRSVAVILVYLLMILWLKPSVDLANYLNQIRNNRRFF